MDNDYGTLPGLVKLPDVRVDDDPAAALDRLAAAYGPNAVQGLIRFFQNNNNGKAITAWQGRKAAQEIDRVMQIDRISYIEARRVVANRWGYHGSTRMSNFHKIADAGWFALFSQEPPRPPAKPHQRPPIRGAAK